MVELRKIAERPEGEASGEDFDNFASLMRFSYNDRHLELLGWAENMASLGREAQKRFSGMQFPCCGKVTCFRQEWEIYPIFGDGKGSSAKSSPLS